MIGRSEIAARTGSPLPHTPETLDASYDVRRTNDAIDRLLAVTTNPRHRFLLQAFHRHRFLEIAGRYEEIFAPEMMAPEPVYHFFYAKMTARVVGNDVKNLYAHWGQTNQTIFYAVTEQIAVADNYVASVATLYQQRLGPSWPRPASRSTIPMPTTCTTPRVRSRSGPTTTSAGSSARTSGSRRRSWRRSSSWRRTTW